MKSILFFAAAVMLAIAPAFVRAQSPTSEKVTSVEGITEYKLPNGTHFLLFPDPSRPVVTVNLTVRNPAPASRRSARRIRAEPNPLL